MNGHRLGVSENLYLKAKVIEKYVVEISVWNHKTADYYGPGKTTLNMKGYSWLQIFVTSARKQLHNIKDNNAFLSWNGSAMKSGDVSKQLHTVWFNTGISDNHDFPKSLSWDIIRKSTSTGIREKETGLTKKQLILLLASPKRKKRDEGEINTSLSTVL